MKLRQLLLVITGTVCLPAISHAQLTLSAGLEYLQWEEDTTPAVTEDGFLFALGVGYTQGRDSGFLVGYRGRLWTGVVDYEGSTLLTNQPVTSTTNYLGLTNELQGRWRRPLEGKKYRLDILAGLGIDAWRRELSSVQREDYLVAYLRTGLEFDSASSNTWLAGLGVKYPFWIREDAHLTNIGFDSNPELSPGGKISAYAHLGYRMSRWWSIVGYADGYRFSKSDPVTVTEVRRGLGTVTVFQPASDMLFLGVKLERVLR
ncbi:MAG: hypothetical protein JSU95_12470 [Betaproteobacteria bacterium]|nr:MAG: hypothetical protein JSU95_12470 [Betaproteobacteria bacterium]